MVRTTKINKNTNWVSDLFWNFGAKKYDIFLNSKQLKLIKKQTDSVIYFWILELKNMTYFQAQNYQNK